MQTCLSRVLKCGTDGGPVEPLRGFSGTAAERPRAPLHCRWLSTTVLITAARRRRRCRAAAARWYPRQDAQWNSAKELCGQAALSWAPKSPSVSCCT